MSKRSFRTRALVTCLAATMILGMVGCGATPTEAFTDPGESIPAISQSGGSGVIDNTGKIVYSLDEAAYAKLISIATPTGNMTLTGHGIYKDTDNKMFIISGYEAVYLEGSSIPRDSWNTLREEQSGNRLFVQVASTEEQQEQMVANWMSAWKSANTIVSNAKSNSFSGKYIVVNNQIMDITVPTNKPVFENGVVYIPASALLQHAGNITAVSADSVGITFNVTGSSSTHTMHYTIDFNDPDTVTSGDNKSTIESENDIIYVKGDEIYIDPVALMPVFDWNVQAFGGILEGKSGVLSIVTDITLYDGHAVQASACVADLPADDSAAVVGDDIQQQIDAAQERLELEAEMEVLAQKAEEAKQEQERIAAEEEVTEEEKKAAEEAAKDAEEAAKDAASKVEEANKPKPTPPVNNGGSGSSSKPADKPAEKPAGGGASSAPSKPSGGDKWDDLAPGQDPFGGKEGGTGGQTVDW